MKRRKCKREKGKERYWLLGMQYYKLYCSEKGGRERSEKEGREGEQEVRREMGREGYWLMGA